MGRGLQWWGHIRRVWRGNFSELASAIFKTASLKCSLKPASLQAASKLTQSCGLLSFSCKGITLPRNWFVGGKEGRSKHVLDTIFKDGGLLASLASAIEMNGTRCLLPSPQLYVIPPWKVNTGVTQRSQGSPVTGQSNRVNYWCSSYLQEPFPSILLTVSLTLLYPGGKQRDQHHVTLHLHTTKIWLKIWQAKLCPNILQVPSTKWSALVSQMWFHSEFRLASCVVKSNTFKSLTESSSIPASSYCTS